MLIKRLMLEEKYNPVAKSGNSPAQRWGILFKTLLRKPKADSKIRAHVKLSGLARRYVRFKAKQTTLRNIGKLGKIFNRYMKYREEGDHESFGFSCLHHVCPEGVGNLEIHVKNKNGLPGSVRVRTVDGAAKAGDDFQAVDKILEFQMGEERGIVEIPIFDDDASEDDEDFFVELADANTGRPLLCTDTRTRVTIIDDDRQ